MLLEVLLLSQVPEVLAYTVLACSHFAAADCAASHMRLSVAIYIALKRFTMASPW